MPILEPDIDIKKVVGAALAKTGNPDLAPVNNFRDALSANGVNLNALAEQLANLIFNGKEGVKRQAILDAAALFGADIRESAAPPVPQIVINIMSDESKVQQIFTPEREV